MKSTQSVSSKYRADAKDSCRPGSKLAALLDDETDDAEENTAQGDAAVSGSSTDA